MLKKNTDLVCVSLADKVLKIAHIKSPGSTAKLVDIHVQDLKETPETGYPSVLRAALNKLGVKNADVILTAPPSVLTTKNIEVPSVNSAEIQSIVDLQAGRHTPFSREEIQMGYVTVGSYKGSYTKVLLVIANKANLKKSVDAIESGGFKVKQVLFPAEAVGRFYSGVIGAQGAASPSGVIDVGKYSTEFILISKGNVICSRNIPVGVSQLNEEGDSARTKLMEELGKTIESYKADDIDAVPEQFYFTADTPITRVLINEAQEKHQWKCGVLSYMDSIKTGKGVLENVAKHIDTVSLLDVIAPALHYPGFQVNLLPEEVELQKSIEIQGREVFKASILGLLLFVTISATIGLKVFFKNAYLTRIKEQNSATQGEVEVLERTSDTTHLIKNFLRDRMVTLEMINEFYRTIPREVYLTNITLSKDGNIVLQGVSEIASVVFDLGTTLKESPLFKSVDIQSTSAKKDRGKDATAFEITLMLKSGDAPVMDAEE